MGLLWSNYRINNTRNVTEVREVEKHVHEHRAPTDASVRLLQEMEAKATRQVIEKLVVDTNELKGVVIAFGHQGVTGLDNVQFWCKFNLNGHDYEFRTDIDRTEIWELRSNYVREILHKAMVEFIFKKFSEAIFKEITKDPDVRKVLGTAMNDHVAKL